jgi:TP901 family phage tail tape measure protein
MAGIGLLNEATIRITFDVKDEEVKTIQSTFRALAKALNLENAAAQFQALDTALAETRGEVGRLTAEMRDMRSEVASSAQKAEAAITELEAAQKKLANGTKTMAANMANAYRKGVTAGQQMVATQRQMAQVQKDNEAKARREVTALNALATSLNRTRDQRIADLQASRQQAQSRADEEARRERAALDALNATITEVVQQRDRETKEAQERERLRLEEQFKRERAALDALNATLAEAAAARDKETREAQERQRLNMEAQAKREAAALAQLNQQRAEAAQKAALMARYEKLMGDVVKQGFGFYTKYGAAIEAVTKARNGDAKALANYMDKLEAVIALENKRKGALKSGMFTNAAGEQVRMSLMEQVSARISDAEKRVDALFRASYRLTMVGHTLRRFSQDIFRLGSEVMNTFGEFEYMLNRARGALSVFSGATLSGRDGATVMREGVTELAQELKVFPAQDVAQSLYFWGSTTGQVVKTVDDLAVTMRGLNPIMKTAAMTNTSYEQTIKGVYSILTQYYGGSLERADEVTMQLFESTQRTAAEFTDLIQSFKMVGPVAAQAGASFSDVNATLGQLADLGIRGTMAGRGLRQFFIQMVRPSGPAQKALDKRFNELAQSTADPFQGKSFFETTFPEGEFVGIQEHMRNLAIATEELSEAERNRLLAQISTANMLPLVTALVTEQRLELHKLAGANKDYTTDAERAAAFFNRNWKLLDDSWNALRGTIDRTVEAIRINIGAVVSDALRPFIEAIQDVLDKFNEFIKQNPALVAAIGKLVAILGVGAGLAGAVLVVAGALTGLGAAIALVADAFEPWRNRIMGAVSAIGFLFVALVDNFDYIKNTAIQVIENLNNAFGGMEDSIGGVGDLFAQIIAPARELMGIFVRITADIILRVSEMIEAFSELEFAGDIINGLIAILGVFVSGRIIGGILGVANAMRVLIATMVVGKITAATKALSLFFTVASSRGAAAGLGTLGKSLLGLVGGPLGFAGLAVSAGFLAYELFPPFKDAVDALTASFANMEQNLTKTIDSMGDAGVVMSVSLVKWNLKVADVRELQAAKAEADKEVARLEKFLAVFADDTAKKLADQNLKSIEEARDRYARAFPNAPETQIQEYLDTFVSEDAAPVMASLRAAQARQANLAGELAQLHEDRSGLIAGQMDVIRGQYADFVKHAIALGRDIDTSDQAFYGAVNKLLDSGVAPEVAGIVADRVLLLAEKMTPEEVERTVKGHAAYRQAMGGIGGTLADLPATLIMDILGSGRVGAESSRVTSELERFVDKVLSQSDPTEIRRMLLTPLTEYGFDIKESLAGIAKLPAFEGVAEAIGMAMQKQMDLSGEIPLGQIEANLKEVLDTMIHDATASVVPMFSDLAAEIQTLSVYGPAAYDDMAKAIMGAILPDGQTLLEAFAEGELPLGQAGLNLMEIAKNLVEQGFGGEELARIVSIGAEEAANDVGDGMVEGIRRGLSESLSADRLSMESLVDMQKLGSTASQVRKAIGVIGGKVLDKAFSGNLQMRIAGRDELNSVLDIITDNFTRVQGRPSEGKRERQMLSAISKQMPKADPIVRAALKEFILGLHADGLITAEQVRNWFPKITIPLPADLLDITVEEKQDLVKGALGGLGGAPKESQMGEDTGISSGLTKLATTAIGSLVKEIQSSASAELVGEAYATVMRNGAYAGVVNVATSEGANVVGLDWIEALGIAMVNQVQTTANDMKQVMQAGSAGALNTAWAGGRTVANFWANAVKNGLNGSDISGNMKMVVNTASFATQLAAGPAGVGVGETWAQGVANGVNNMIGVIDAAMDKATKSGQPTNSPPATGPLKEIDKWGEEVGGEWGKGYRKGAIKEARKASSAVRNELRAGHFGAGNMTLDSNNRREVKITIDVASKDGSVDRAKMADIRRGVMDALALADLEHMVTVQ